MLIFVGFNLTFFPQFLLGMRGMPRRYHAYPAEFHQLHMASSAGAVVLALGYLLPLFYFSYSLRSACRAGANPFGALGIEWQTRSPPPTHNFDRTPVVPEHVYDYAPPGPRPTRAPAAGAKAS